LLAAGGAAALRGRSAALSRLLERPGDRIPVGRVTSVLIAVIASALTIPGARQLLGQPVSAPVGLVDPAAVGLDLLSAG